ncbi:hypothetical protein SUGI_0812260 [Cryptomeria japonica]|uniref:heavy metal-associated isoprenylated plant protein 28 n=1 Tax=Cryptomeria japonica TaxID=3369 RepID=UPI002414A038|nr:heavy metal-associated isoprenylated plant protein 28 [Cryptomeria japonica]GLJ39737.1 hypothetical protein SUGI_0812260 [Cryptomeria japonica]
MSLVPTSRLQKVEMRVPMYSYGCERKIRKALSHFKGLLSVDIDFHQQKVSVTGMLNRDQILSTIKAKRKNAEFWSCKEDQMILHHSNSGKSNDSPVNGPKKKKKAESVMASKILFQQYERSCQSTVWCVDSHGNVCTNSVMIREEVKSVTLFSGISFSFRWVHGFLLEVLYEVITCSSSKD